MTTVATRLVQVRPTIDCAAAGIDCSTLKLDPCIPLGPNLVGGTTATSFLGGRNPSVITLEGQVRPSKHSITVG